MVVADRDAGLINAAADELRLAGHQAIPVACDVTDRSEVEAMVEQAIRPYGRLDAAFNNTGINCDAAPMLGPARRNRRGRIMAV